MTKRIITGRSAVEHARTYGRLLSKYTDPIEEARSDISVVAAEEIISEDPNLIYIEHYEVKS